ncbi:MAG: ATP-binding protein [Acidimicrobiales bacterium]
MTGPTLRDAAKRADADRFVGRREVLAAAAELLSDSPSRFLCLHGPGGIGKSATLRAIGRMAPDAGYAVASLDPLDLADDLEDQLERALSSTEPKVLLLLDEIDALGSRLPAVRDRLLDALPASSRLVLAGRDTPDRSWRTDGLDAIVVDLALDPLDDDEATELLVARGIAEDQRPDLVAWAQGSPLALTVAASAPRTTTGAAPSPVEALEARLTSWLAGSEILDVPADVLEVAALAPAVDARLLAAALPARPTRAAMGQLGALPVVERVGGRLVLHEVLAAAIRARMDATSPERARTLRRRIVTQLATSARLGDIRALVELSQFISDPDLRQVVSNRPSPSLFTSHPTGSELDAFAQANGFDREPDWAELRPWLEGCAYRLCVRRRDGSIVMHGAFSGIADLPDLGPVTRSLRRAAAVTAADPGRSFAGAVLFADGTDHERIEAARLGTGALMHQHGVADMQAVLIHYPSPDRRPLEALSAIAAQLPDDLPRNVALSDFRPFGAVGFVERIVLGELGLAPPATDAAALLADDDDPQRQAQLRSLLDRVFGEAPEEQRLRQAIELAHLPPHRSEHECLEALHVSRSTWFRLLRKARERLLSADR